MLSGKSGSVVTQALKHLSDEGLVTRIHYGIWGESSRFSAFEVVPFLIPGQQLYVSFVTALHLHGIIEQIPQVMTVASMVHSRTVRTKAGVYSIHQLEPNFFKGFDWYQKTGSFLIAEPEKALADSLYLSVKKKNNFGHFPELHFPKGFKISNVKKWIDCISDPRARKKVHQSLELLRNQ
jgi:predicted transcriptional regulator of viral defense system